MADAYEQYFFPLLKSAKMANLWYDRDDMQEDDITNEYLLATRWVVGSPDTVVDRLTDMENRLRVGHLMLLLHFGNMPKDKVLYNSTRFIQEVAPRLRPIWREWEDRWWPRDTLPRLTEPAPLPNAVSL